MKNPLIKIKDINFVRYFLANEIDLDPSLTLPILERNAEIVKSGEPNTTVCKGDTIFVTNPTSVTRFLFNVLYHSLSPHLSGDIYQDKLGLGLFKLCYDYVHDGDSRFHKVDHEFTRPVIVSAEKLPVPTFILQELVDPIVGATVRDKKVLFLKCKFTDVCRRIETPDDLQSQYKISTIPYDNFPLLICNTSVQNKAAEASHITINLLQSFFGERKAHKIIRDILLDSDSGLMEHLVTILKIINGDPFFVLDFIDYFRSFAGLTADENAHSLQSEYETVMADNYLSKHIKTADQSTQVTKQWSQWSMLMGLIEKQLTPMRGSMWPTTENVKPFEDVLRRNQQELAAQKGKKHLNFEELLETYRDLYNHKAQEPGKILEHMLKVDGDRVWKV